MYYIDSIVPNVKKIIEEKGLKKKKVAEIAGYSEQAFSSRLNGRRIIDANDVWYISQALGVTPNDLYGI